jgi:hypothetical protein
MHSLPHADFISVGFEAPAGQTYASAADLGKFMALIFNDDKPFNPQTGQVYNHVQTKLYSHYS